MFTSCSKDGDGESNKQETHDVSFYQNLIQGEWKHIKTYHRIYGEYNYTNGCTIKFDKNSTFSLKGKPFYFITDPEADFSNKYKIEKRTAGVYDKEYMFLVLTVPSTTGMTDDKDFTLVLYEDEMVLSDGVSDGNRYFFERIK